MKPYWTDGERAIYCGDCREILPQLKGTGIITDPPYELGFMGKDWDKQGVSFQKETWQIIRESCLPGAMLLSFGGTRTFHRIAIAIEDAGWELRDTIMWIYGSGFPKSLDISKAIDKAKGEYIKGEVLPSSRSTGASQTGIATTFREKTAANPQTPEAQLWSGYGTALKPAYEPILVCMNPLDGTFANNALKHGVAGLNIDGCRVEYQSENDRSGWSKTGANGSKGYQGTETFKIRPISAEEIQERCVSKGRFPANIIHDGSEEVLELFPNTHAPHTSGGGFNFDGSPKKTPISRTPSFTDSGSAARFFYCAKASKSERNAGCEGLEILEVKTHGEMKPDLTGSSHNTTGQKPALRQNNHPTVKPLALMKYLVKLISPPKDAVLIDPFMGSGSTLVACQELGIKCIGIETDEYNCEIAVKRLTGQIFQSKLWS